MLIMINNIGGGINIGYTISCLSDIEFHYMMRIISDNSLLQFIAEDNICRHYLSDTSIVAQLFIRLINLVLHLLLYNDKKLPAHLISFLINYMESKSSYCHIKQMKLILEYYVWSIIININHMDIKLLNYTNLLSIINFK